MPIYYDGSYTTALGEALIAKLLATAGKIEYTKAAVGEGYLPEGAAPGAMTDLDQYVMDAMISAVRISRAGQVEVDLQISNVAIAEGFSVTEAGLWANDPDLGEILFCYVTLQEHPEWVSPNSAPVNKLATFTINTSVGSAAVDQTVIDPGSFLTANDIGVRVASQSSLADKANLVHTHSAIDITSGTLAAERLPAASTTAQGAIRIATDAEAAGTLTTVVVNPKQLQEAVGNVQIVKSKQRTMIGPAITSGMEITIAAVNVDKSVIIISSASQPNVASGTSAFFDVSFKNSTTLQIYASPNSFQSGLGIQIVEFY